MAVEKDAGVGPAPMDAAVDAPGRRIRSVGAVHDLWIIASSRSRSLAQIWEKCFQRGFIKKRRPSSETAALK
jgi:hypothetical protein